MNSYSLSSPLAAVVLTGAIGISSLSACAGGSEELIDRVSEELTNTVEDIRGDQEKEFRPTCGLVGASLSESLKAKDGIFFAQASALAPNLVSVYPGSGHVIVKLLSLGYASDSPELALSRLAQLVSGGVYLFQHPGPCTITTPGGAVGTSGQLITPQGIDVAEQLVSEGLANEIVARGACGEEMLAPCYEALLGQ